MADHAPDVLIQHPTRRTAYLVPGERLSDFATNAGTWSRFGEETVTFVIPDPNTLIAEIPPALRAPEAAPAVHIQDPSRESAYYLDAEELAEFEIDSVEDVQYDISFVVPVGLELIEEMPPLMRGLLQSQENPRRAASPVSESALTSS